MYKQIALVMELCAGQNLMLFQKKMLPDEKTSALLMKQALSAKATAIGIAIAVALATAIATTIGI